jgi:UDP-GlcNAc:undecaprenyl-phosphate/decaprenyl-phosphate GlcNAc-1-phosphate transferase
MSHVSIVVVLFLVTGAVSAFLVWKAIDVGTQLHIVNRPSSRALGSPGIPRIGGIAVVIAFFVGVGSSFALPVSRFPIEVERIALICIGGTVITAVMVADDAFGLSPWIKLAAQVGVACLIVLPRLQGPNHGISIDQFNAPIAGLVSLPVSLAVLSTLIWFVAMMNTLNWIDGVDGLAPTVTLVAATTMFLHTYFWPREDPQFTISILPLVLGAAVIGFLPFNWHPARITLGDSGANFIGLCLAAISIIGGAKLATALLVLGLPLLDVLWVVSRRAMLGRPLTAADTSHLHHRLLGRGWSIGQIVGFVGGVSLLFGILSLVLPNRESKLFAILMLAAVSLLTLGRPWTRRNDTSGESNSITIP